MKMSQDPTTGCGLLLILLAAGVLLITATLVAGYIDTIAGMLPHGPR